MVCVICGRQNAETEHCKPKEVTVYYIQCNSDQDRWIEVDDVLNGFKTSRTKMKFDKGTEVYIKLKSFLSSVESEPTKEHDRIDVRLVIIFEDGSIRRTIGMDLMGNFLIDGMVYSKSSDLSALVCSSIPELSCFFCQTEPK